MPNDFRGNEGVLRSMDSRWKHQAEQRRNESGRNTFPKEFKMTKSEYGEHMKQMGKEMTKMANEGYPTYRGSRIVIQ